MQNDDAKGSRVSLFWAHQFIALTRGFGSIQSHPSPYTSPPITGKAIEDEGDSASIKSNDSGQKKSARKVKQLRVIDPKAGQSLSILLGSVSILYLRPDSAITPIPLPVHPV